jgi:23S rRNA (adenine2503-C2)-methyltransferase
MLDLPLAAPILMKDGTAADLLAWLAPLGVDLRLARRIQAAVLQRGGDAIPTALPEVPKTLLRQIRDAVTIPRLTLVEKAVSAVDGFAKYLFKGDGPEPFETVRIPLMHRPGDEKYVVCVSSQVGCAMGCTFCATGRMGFRRNLAAWEIVDQVMQVRADSPYPVRGVVFMGQGEPFLNYGRVMKAAEIMCEPVGLGIEGKAISMSTVGIVPMIRRFTAERRPYRLVVSLTSAEPEQRKSLLPVENTHGLDELMAAVREYHEVTGKRVTLAWTMIAGVNTRRADAQALAKITQGIRVRIDLIDVNDATGQFRPPGAAERQAFRDALTEELGMPVAWRYSGGQDIHGACGMLAGLAVAKH